MPLNVIYLTSHLTCRFKPPVSPVFLDDYATPEWLPPSSQGKVNAFTQPFSHSPSPAQPDLLFAQKQILCPCDLPKGG